MRLLNAVRGEKAAQNEVEDRYFPRHAPRVSGVEGYALPTQSSALARRSDNLAGSSLPSLPLVLRNYRSPRICTASEPSHTLGYYWNRYLYWLWPDEMYKSVSSRILAALINSYIYRTKKSQRKFSMKVSRVSRYRKMCGFQYIAKAAHMLFLIILAWFYNWQKYLFIKIFFTCYIWYIRTFNKN